MKDVTTDMRTLDFQRALRQYGQLGLAMADEYAERALHTADTSERDRLEGVSEGLTILASALVDASSWDSPDRPRATNEDKAGTRTDLTLDARRSWQGYYDAGLPWTGEFEDAVNRGEVDVS